MEGEDNSRKVFVLEKGREAGNEGELEGLPMTIASLSQCASLLSDPGGPSHSSRKPSGEAMGLSSGTGRLLKFWFYLLPPAGFPHHF